MSILPDSSDLRRFMVDRQIRTYDVTDQTLLERFLDVPREAFLPDSLQSLAYSDKPLEITAGGQSRCLLAPLVLARLLQAAEIRTTDTVLDVAGGFGYTAALVSGLAASVVALEEAPFAEGASRAFIATETANVTSTAGDLGTPTGLPGPFDVIVVNGGVEVGLEALLALLAPGGRLLTVERALDDPTGRAGKAKRFDRTASGVSARVLFDAVARVLPAFARKPAFVF